VIPAFGLCGRCGEIHCDRDLDLEIFRTCIPCQAHLVELALEQAGVALFDPLCRYPKLVGLLSLYCGSADVAEGLAQETLMRVVRDWRKLSRQKLSSSSVSPSSRRIRHKSDAAAA
jgi:hypothetical protein